MFHCTFKRIALYISGLEWASTSLKKIEIFRNLMMIFMTKHKLPKHAKIEKLLRLPRLTLITPTVKSKVENLGPDKTNKS